MSSEFSESASREISSESLDALTECVGVFDFDRLLLLDLPRLFDHMFRQLLDLVSPVKISVSTFSALSFWQVLEKDAALDLFEEKLLDLFGEVVVDFFGLSIVLIEELFDLFREKLLDLFGEVVVDFFGPSIVLVESLFDLFEEKLLDLSGEMFVDFFGLSIVLVE